MNKRRCLLEQNLYLAHMKNGQGMLYVDERQLVKIKDILTEVFNRGKNYLAAKNHRESLLKQIKSGMLSK